MTRAQTLSGWRDRYDLRLSPQSMPGVAWILLCGIVLCSIAMRVHSLNRSFWLDEAWVANAILSPTIPEMVYYEGWLNTTPPLFLLLVRFVTQLFGVSHVSMRLVPFVFGVMAIPVMAYFALRLLKPWYALVAVLLLALSPDHVILAQSLKQYTADVFVALALLILGYHFLRTRSRKAFYAAVITFGVCGFLSYQAVMFMPIFLLVPFLHNRRSNRSRGSHEIGPRDFDVIILFSVICIVSLVNYLYFIEPNVKPELVRGYVQHFYHRVNILESIRYFLAALANLTHPLGSTIRASSLLRVGALALVLVGVVGFVLRKEEGLLPRWEKAGLLTLPIVSLVVLNGLGQYPMARTPRLVLFVFPVIAILFASATQCAVQLCALIGDRVSMSGFVATQSENVLPPSVLIAIVCVFVARLSFVDLVPYVRLGPREDAMGAMRYLSEQHTNGDLLYVHRLMREQYKFYAKILPINGGRVIEGNIGMWCCRPGQVSNEELSPAEVLSAEFARLDLSSEDRHVRLLFTGRQSPWGRIDYNERHEFAVRLAEKCCIQVKTTAFSSVQIDEYTCQPNASR